MVPYGLCNLLQLGLWWLWKVCMLFSLFFPRPNIYLVRCLEFTECMLKKLLIYYRLGHREQKDEWAPRRVDVFTRHNVLPPDAIVSAGGMNSSCTAGMIAIHPSIFS